MDNFYAFVLIGAVAVSVYAYRKRNGGVLYALFAGFLSAVLTPFIGFPLVWLHLKFSKHSEPKETSPTPTPSKSSWRFAKWLVPVLVVYALISLFLALPDLMKEADARRDEFEANKEDILKKAETLLSEEKYHEAEALLDPYDHVSEDPDLHRLLSSAKAEHVEKEPENGYWIVDEDVSAMDDSRSVTLLLPASNEVKAWLDTVAPNLLVRCSENRTEVYVNAKTQMNVESSYHTYTVRIRMDDGKAFTQKWNGSTNGEALFARNAIALLKKMAKAETMLFEFTPFNANPVLVTFKVKGLDRLLPKVAKACRWTYP